MTYCSNCGAKLSVGIVAQRIVAMSDFHNDFITGI